MEERSGREEGMECVMRMSGEGRGGDGREDLDGGGVRSETKVLMSDCEKLGVDRDDYGLLNQLL